MGRDRTSVAARAAQAWQGGGVFAPLRMPPDVSLFEDLRHIEGLIAVFRPDCLTAWVPADVPGVAARIETFCARSGDSVEQDELVQIEDVMAAASEAASLQPDEESYFNTTLPERPPLLATIGMLGQLPDLGQQPVEEVAAYLRNAFEPFWEAWRMEFDDDWDQHDGLISAQMCRYTSLGASWWLRRHGVVWNVAGADGEIEISGGNDRKVFASAGIKTPDGIWHPHAWLVADGRIVDVTAVQFGLSPVIVTSHDDARYKSELNRAGQRAWMRECFDDVRFLKRFMIVREGEEALAALLNLNDSPSVSAAGPSLSAGRTR